MTRAIPVHEHVPLAAGEPPIRPLQQLVAAMMGNVLEYYDFIVYAFLAATLARKFFHGDGVAGLLASFATFGVGFLARPLGGAIIGRLADTRGRRFALQLTIFGMALGTVGIGVLPTYETIGMGAPILLVTLRLMQGLAAGGEWGTSTALIVESAPAGKRGFFGGLGQASIASASLLSSVVVAVVTGAFSATQMDEWAWRVPFLLGGILLVIGVYMRRTLVETPAFRNVQQQTSDIVPIDRRSALKMMGRAFGFTIIWTVSYYVMLSYMPTFLVRHAGLSQAQALFSNSLALVVLVAATPFFGWLSDRIGRKPLLLACCIGFAVLAYPLFHIVLDHASLTSVVIVQIIFNLFIAAFSGAAPAALCELFPTRARTTLLSIGYSLATGIFGGFAPFIATALIQATGSPIAPTYYLIASAVVSGVVIFFLRETAHEPLH
ncbi:MAG: MFS transporter [Janthinobacterium lividum]